MGILLLLDISSVQKTLGFSVKNKQLCFVLLHPPELTQKKPA